MLFYHKNQVQRIFCDFHNLFWPISTDLDQIHWDLFKNTRKKLQNILGLGCCDKTASENDFRFFVNRHPCPNLPLIPCSSISSHLLKSLSIKLMDKREALYQRHKLGGNVGSFYIICHDYSICLSRVFFRVLFFQIYK